MATVSGKGENPPQRTARGERGRFAKGTAPGPGRPKGSVNRATLDLLEWGRELLASEEYRESARGRLLAGEATHLETYLLNRIFGKPKETVEHQGRPPFQIVFRGANRDPLAPASERRALDAGDGDHANRRDHGDAETWPDEVTERPLRF